MMVVAAMWAISGVYMIVEYLEGDYLWVGVFTGLMFLNAFNYTSLKSKL